MSGPYMHIGEVASRTNLSLRTIRHYEEVGLVVPSGRSQGGFRLYVEDDVQRLLLVRRMKPFFSLEETKDLLDLLAAVAAAEEPDEQLIDRLRMYREAVDAHRGTLREQLTRAEAFSAELARTISGTRSAPA